MSGAGKSLMDWQKRKTGGARSRFAGTAHHGNYGTAALNGNHPALVEGRTLFPSRVKKPSEVDRVLIDGHNNPKIGRFIERGAWRGMPVLTLTLEERATCPRSCDNWACCYGSAMPMPRRHAHGPELVAALDEELRYYAGQAPGGFVVRLHILGDFYSLEYIQAWHGWMREIPQLHVWGYTARPVDSEIGGVVQSMNEQMPKRWRVRFSVPANAPPAPLQVSTFWWAPGTAPPPAPAGMIDCPQQTDATASCGTCSLCFTPSMDATRVRFAGHGMSRRGAAA